jgi:hypothetical protein
MYGIDIEGIDQAIVAIAEYPERTTRALVRAMNRGIAAAKTFMASNIAKDVGMKVGDVRDALPMQEATFGRPEARLAASLRRIPLIKMGATGPYPSRGRGAVRFRGRRYEGAFIAVMRSGHRGIYRRVGRQRLPLTKELRGPSLGHVFRKFRSQGIARAIEMFDRNFAHELKRLGGATGSAGGSD